MSSVTNCERTSATSNVMPVLLVTSSLAMNPIEWHKDAGIGHAHDNTGMFTVMQLKRKAEDIQV